MTKALDPTTPKEENSSDLAKQDELPKKEDAESDYDEEGDDDYDPQRKQEDEQVESDPSDNEPEPDYSAISTEYSQVRTRGQRYRDNLDGPGKRTAAAGLVTESLHIDVDEVFRSLQSNKDDDWRRLVGSSPSAPEPEKKNEDAFAEEKIRIMTTYTFAGKLVRESKLVDANSAEAKAYMNSTNGIVNTGAEEGPHKSYVTVVRRVKGVEEPVSLRIKLKRPSLIDKFLAGDKKNKLTTLEKSRLDWASFVDKKSLKDDLALHNKGGYLEKQDFLGRVEAKKDLHYQQAKEVERQRQWQLQQKM